MSKRNNKTILEEKTEYNRIKDKTSKVMSLRWKMAVIMNTVILLLEICAIFFSGRQVNFMSLRYYTDSSNCFSLFACSLMLVANGKRMHNKDYHIPRIIRLIKYMSVCCLTVTFIVVITILAPFSGEDGYRKMLFEGAALFKHFLCPVLAFLTYIFFESDSDMKIRYMYYALVPTMIYGGFAIYYNYKRVIHGPYPFLYVYEQPLYATVSWGVVILFIALFVSWFIHILADFIGKRCARL